MRASGDRVGRPYGRRVSGRGDIVRLGVRRGWRGSLATRLTVVATAVTAAVLVLLLAGLYLVLSTRLEQAVDTGLRARYGDVSSAVVGGDALAVTGEQYAELHPAPPPAGTTSREQVQRSRGLLAAPLLVPDPGGVRRLQFSDRTLRLPGSDDRVPLRVLAGPVAGGRVLAVAASRRPQEESARQLLVALAVAGPLLLLLVAVVVGRTARAALLPVDALTGLAERISEGRDAARRLPPLEGDDELSRLSHTLDAMLGRLAVAFERERAFVDDASHELRTPITVLRGEIELALSDLDDRAGVEQSLRAALGEAQRLSSLAEDLLVLARERAGGLVLQADPLDVHVLLQRTADRLAAATGLQLKVDSPPLLAIGDPTRLEQLLANLITNAAEAGAGQVLLRARRVEPDALLMQVEDDGPGFPPGFAESAFERFTRADQARTRTTGAGLGLSLVSAIAAASGGSVRATTSPRLGGACVEVRLPTR